MRNPCGLVGSRESLTLCLACHAKVVSTFYIPERKLPKATSKVRSTSAQSWLRKVHAVVP